MHFAHIPSQNINPTLYRYNISTGELVGMFGTEDELDCPEGIAIGIDGTIYVASFLSDTVVRVIV